MPATLHNLCTLELLEDALKKSEEKPVFLFKHSLNCLISADVSKTLQTILESADSSCEYYLVTVQTDKNISDEIASRFSIKHETPQAIVLRHGQVVWSTSHYRINKSSIAQAIEKALST